MASVLHSSVLSNYSWWKWSINITQPLICLSWNYKHGLCILRTFESNSDFGRGQFCNTISEQSIWFREFDHDSVRCREKRPVISSLFTSERKRCLFGAIWFCIFGFKHMLDQKTFAPLDHFFYFDITVSLFVWWFALQHNNNQTTFWRLWSFPCGELSGMISFRQTQYLPNFNFLATLKFPFVEDDLIFMKYRTGRIWRDRAVCLRAKPLVMLRCCRFRAGRLGGAQQGGQHRTEEQTDHVSRGADDWRPGLRAEESVRDCAPVAAVWYRLWRARTLLHWVRTSSMGGQMLAKCAPWRQWVSFPNQLPVQQ